MSNQKPARQFFPPKPYQPQNGKPTSASNPQIPRKDPKSELMVDFTEKFRKNVTFLVHFLMITGCFPFRHGGFSLMTMSSQMLTGTYFTAQQGFRLVEHTSIFVEGFQIG
jgi:hypothetical protein